jgi:hypothetical protein
MTEHGHNFIREIAEAYRALEMEPQYQSQIKDWERINKRDGDAIARLELRLMEMSQEHDALKAKLRSVEAERDEAGFRQLEAEDTTNNLLTTLRSVQASVGSAIAAATASGKDQTVMMSVDEMDGFANYKAELQRKHEENIAKAEAVRLGIEAAEKQRQADEAARTASEAASQAPGTWTLETMDLEPKAEGSVPADPTLVQEPVTSTTTTTEDVISSSESGEVSQSLPTATVDTTQSQTASSTTVEPTQSVASPASQPSGQYSGKRYYEWPYYVSLTGWLAQGGTEDDYNWRPEGLASAR